MKKAGWIATVAAGVVLVGGGAWAATTLAVSDEGTAAVVETTAPTPAASATPEATPTAEVTPEVTYTADESELLDLIRWRYVDNTGWSEADLMQAAHWVCDELAGGTERNTLEPIEGASLDDNREFRIDADRMLCNPS